MLMILLFVVSISVFIFFRSFFVNRLSPLAVEILAAALGTMMTIIITAILLNAQSVTEEKKEKSIGIFQLKVKLYSEFLEYVQQTIEDNKLEPKEIGGLIRKGATIALVADTFAEHHVVLFVKMCAMFRKFDYLDLTDDEKSEFDSTIRQVFSNQGYDDNDLDGLLDQETLSDYVSVGGLTSILSNDLSEKELTADNLYDIKYNAAMVQGLVDEVKKFHIT